jgi:hypothetical protein
VWQEVCLFPGSSRSISSDSPEIDSKVSLAPVCARTFEFIKRLLDRWGICRASLTTVRVAANLQLSTPHLIFLWCIRQGRCQPFSHLTSLISLTPNNLADFTCVSPSSSRFCLIRARNCLRDNAKWCIQRLFGSVEKVLSVGGRRPEVVPQVLVDRLEEFV